jgi:EmrB/QacA subfamily drug resistance transporter
MPGRFRKHLSPEVVVGVVLVSSMFMTVMDVTVVNVAIPTIAREFHAPISSVQWVATGYLLSLAMWIPASGWIGDRFGTKRVLLGAIVIFILGSACCAAADNLTELTAARVFQGVGGGMMQPVGMALLFRTFPPARRARASQILIIPTAVAPAIGPIVGGLLVQHASWRWVFLINIPIGALAVVFGALFLRPQPETPAGRFDLPGFLLGGPGLAILLYGVSRGPIDGWRSAPVVGAIVGGIALLGLLVVVELRTREPMLDLRLFRNRLYLDCTLVAVVGFGAFLGTLFVVPLYLQEARHLSPLASGLATFPEAIGVMVFTQIAGRSYPRIGPRRLQFAGLAWIAAILLAAAVFVGNSTSLWLVRLALFGLGAGVAYVFIAQQAARFATISAADTGRATALAAAIQQASSAAGIALLTTVLAVQSPHGVPPTPTDFGPVFLVAAALALAGALLALRIRDSDAAATMARKTLTAPDPASRVMAENRSPTPLARPPEGTMS